MFKRRNDKNRITAVFKLQFHATQVSEHAMVISVIPAENGKPTAKLEKSTVKEKGCYWENPIYETVKFLQDPKTFKIQERIYYFLISNGSQKGRVLGEFSVNMADYIAKPKPCLISFPFKNSSSDSYLHVTIQRIEDNSNISSIQRDLEENEVLRIKQDGKSLRRQFSTGDFKGTQLNSVEDQSLRKPASNSVRLNGIRRVSNGSDITSSSSDSTLGHQNHPKNEWDWGIVPINDSSTEYSINNSPIDFFPNLRSELVSMSRRVEMSELELQTLRKQIVKEGKKGNELLREISSLKEERDSLKYECEKLKEGGPRNLIEVIREELNYEKETNSNLRMQLQKMQESNEELTLAVRNLEEMLGKNSKGISHLPNRSLSKENALESDDDEAQKSLEDLVKQHSNVQDEYMLEQKFMDLCSEIEMYKRDKDKLEMQIEQLSLDYEILMQENHEFSTRLEQNHLQEQLKMQIDEASRLYLESELKEKSEELSCCLEEIKDLKACYKVLKVDMDTIRSEKMEQEERAVQAEAALNESKAIINQLESVIVKLKRESKNHLEDWSSSLTFVKELETRNSYLEEELEKRTQRYEVIWKL